MNEFQEFDNILQESNVKTNLISAADYLELKDEIAKICTNEQALKYSATLRNEKFRNPEKTTRWDAYYEIPETWRLKFERKYTKKQIYNMLCKIIPLDSGADDNFMDGIEDEYFR